MGIPQYYKRLSESIKGIVVPHRTEEGAAFSRGTLLFDFNCMIYLVLRSVSKDITTFDAEWEATFCQAIVDYTLKIWKEVGKPSRVFLGIDGAVPMAKIRQQRMRRFRVPTDTSSWDTNAITPGTAFMAHLAKRLHALCDAQNWTLSDSTEFGEGEQKCMNYWKRLPKEHQAEPVLVYGLDADLILLCLLTRATLNTEATPVWCFREAAEWEETGHEFLRFSINKLASVLSAGSALPLLDWTMEYLAAMSFLGNDFVPHAIGFQIREGGYDALMRFLKQYHTTGGRLLEHTASGEWKYSLSGIRDVALFLAKSEEAGIDTFLKKKWRQRNSEQEEKVPCRWAVESVLVGQDGRLCADWHSRMRGEWMSGVDAREVCTTYCKGLQWILDYYTGQCLINTTSWFYPWHLPPSWNELRLFVTTTELPSAPGVGDDPPLRPEEHLAMVLPQRSWSLLRGKLRQLPQFLPHYWPIGFGLFSAGRVNLWECEAEIPILSVKTIRILFSV